MSDRTHEDFFLRLVNAAKNNPDWHDDRVEQLALSLRVWADKQLRQTPSLPPQVVAAALERVAKEIREVNE